MSRTHAQWLVGSHPKIKLSAIGEVAANIVGTAFNGLYHLEYRDLEASDWSNEHICRVRLTTYGLATVDGNILTRLLVLAFDAQVRLAIKPRSHWTIDLIFTQRHHRKSKEDCLHEVIPTLEQSVEHIRSGAAGTILT